MDKAEEFEQWMREEEERMKLWKPNLKTTDKPIISPIKEKKQDLQLNLLAYGKIS